MKCCIFERQQHCVFQRLGRGGAGLEIAAGGCSRLAKSQMTNIKKNAVGFLEETAKMLLTAASLGSCWPATAAEAPVLLLGQ